MVQVSIKSNIDDVMKEMTHLERKQLPFATMLAINDTAFAGQRAAKRGMKQYLDNPTPWTVRGVRVKKAKKKDLSGAVYMAGIPGLPGANQDRNDYISMQTEGGSRLAKGRYLAIPTKAGRNKYGNVPRKIDKLNTMLSDKTRFFVGTPKGMTNSNGIWRRLGTTKSKGGVNIRKEFTFSKSARYRPRYPFDKIVTSVIKNTFDNHFSKRLNYALRTSK